MRGILTVIPLGKVSLAPFIIVPGLGSSRSTLKLGCSLGKCRGELFSTNSIGNAEFNLQMQQNSD